MAEEENKGVTNEIGAIRITDEVVAIIAGMAAIEVPGVVSMSGGIAEAFQKCLAARTFPEELR